MTARLVDVIREIADASPERIALWDGHDGAKAPTPMTFGELMQLTAHLVAAFERAGVGADDAVGVWLPNWSSAVAAQLAASAVGAHVIGINTRYNTGEVAHVIRAARPRALLVAEEFNRMDFATRLAAALDVAVGETAGSDDGVLQSLSVLVVAAPGAPLPSNVARFAVGGLEPQQVMAVDLVDGPLGELGSGPATPGRLGAAFTTSGSAFARHDR